VSTHETPHSVPTVHTPAEAAAILRVRQSWLERQAAARKIPFTMLGGAYRFTDDHLAEIVRMNEKIPTAEVPEAPRHPGPRTHRFQAPGQTDAAPIMALRPRPRPNGPRRKTAVA